MHRSSSSSGVVEQSRNFLPNNNEDTDHQLPTYDPQSEVAKKELSHIRFAENAVHAIPLVVALCAIVLWFFSKTESRI